MISSHFFDIMDNMIQNYLIILIIFSAFFSTAPATANIVTGTVKSIDFNKGTIVLTVINSSVKNQKEIIVRIKPVNLPKNLTTGKRIRTWGYYINKTSGIFQGKFVSKPGCRKWRRDSTGVRCRLGRKKCCFGKKKCDKDRKGHLKNR